MVEIPIERLAKHIGDSMENTVKDVKMAIFSGVIFDTRVDTGRLRGNWQTTNHSPAVSSALRLDASGAGAIREAEQTVKADTIDYLTNNLPYAEVWEERDGMVARNVARINRYIREAIK